MKKGKVLFALVVFIMMYKVGLAQQSIIPDINEAYLARLIAHAEANYPQVKTNQLKIDIAKGNISKAHLSIFENLTFSYVYQPSNFTTLTNTTGQGGVTPTQSYFNGFQAGVFFNLGSLLEKPYVVKQAKLEYQEANYEQDMYFLTLTNTIKRRYYAYIVGIANLKLQNQVALDEQSAFNDVKHKFEKGEETFDVFNRAQSSLTTVFAAKIAAEANLLIAKADLEELLGEKLENVQ